MYSLEVKFKQIMTGAIAYVDIPLSDPAANSVYMTDQDTMISTSSVLEVVSYVGAPRDYIVIKLSPLCPRSMVVASIWTPVRGPWYKIMGVSNRLPCIWRADTKNITLLEAKVTLSSTLPNHTL